MAVAVFAVCLGVPAAATAQTNFSLQMSTFNPIAVDPGGNAAASLTVSPLNGFSGAVALSCQITPAPANGNGGCLVSPQSVTPPTDASVTITTTIAEGSPWTAGAYSVTITATAPSTTPQTAMQTLTVLSVTPSFTITVGTVISPPSVPAGGTATATIDVNPLNGYASSQTNPGVTLLCSSVTPVVASPPVCTFSYPNGMTSLPLNGVLATSTLTISTIGPLTPLPTARAGAYRGFYALWLPLPMLALLGAAVGGKRLRKWSMLAFLMMSAMVLLLPACGTPQIPHTETPAENITPNGSYTFTVTGVDANGNAASNISSGATSAVTLGVTTATTD